MNLKHVFKSECPNVEELFANCSTLDTYFANLQKQIPNVKTSNYMKHGFEVLVEAIILCEKRLMRIKKYAPVPSCNNDLFVHGVGEKSRGQKVAVMVCTVNDVEIPLTSNANHLTAFASNAIEHYGVDIEEPKAFRIFSNAKSLHENTQSQFFNDKSTAFYLKHDIEKIVNENKKFWIRFKNMMKSVVVISSKEKQLRPYQAEASKAIFNNIKGQIILPTGTGKSLIAISAIYNEIQEQAKQDKKSPCFLIMTPRIVLTYQLLGETIEFLKIKKQDAQYLNLNSGVFNDDSIKEAMTAFGLPVRDVPSTTNPEEIKYYYEKACKDNVPFIISSTYQSAPQVLKTQIPIHMTIHDEAHNLVDGIGRFATHHKLEVLKIEGDKEIFLTATPAYTEADDTTGMNNAREYGEEIYRKSPKEMIDAGEIVPPYIHQVVIDKYTLKKHNITIDLQDDKLEKNIEFMALMVLESFDEHLKKIKHYSCSPDKIGAKMLVVCKGDTAFQGFFENSSIFNSMKQNRKDIKFFGISSKYGAWLDGERIHPQGGWYKEQFMLALKNLKQEENAIIFHIDMLGEGIDVPGITGVLPFRELGTIKSCQTLGRAMRIIPEDRTSLYNGTRTARDTKKMIKPFAWVIVPLYSINHKDMKEKVTEITKQIRSNMGYMPFEMGEHIDGPGGDGPKKTVPDNGKMPDEVDLRHIVEDPYFTALTEGAISDSINGNDEDFFTIIRKINPK